MRQKLIGLAFAVCAMAMTPLSALADDAKESYDGRLEWYANNRSVTLIGGGTSLMWFLLVALGIICVGVMFMNARRSHLD